MRRRSSLAAWMTAPLPNTAVREAKVPKPYGAMAVSLFAQLISSSAMPSSSHATWRIAATTPALRRQRRGDGKNARRLQAQRHRVAPGLQQQRPRADRRAGAEPGEFRIAGDADAAQLAVGASLALLGPEPLVLRLGGGKLQTGQVVDVVVDQVVGVAIGHRLDRNQVALAQFHVSRSSRRATSSNSSSSEADVEGRPTAR